MDNLCGKDGTAHQGLVAEAEQLDEITLKEYVLTNKNKNINLIALEEVSDPRNIGSIIRSAVAFDIDGLIVKERSFQKKVNYFIRVQAVVLNILRYLKYQI